MTARTVAADASVRRGRLAKAEQFATAAAELQYSLDRAGDLDDKRPSASTPGSPRPT